MYQESQQIMFSNNTGINQLIIDKKISHMNIANKNDGVWTTQALSFRPSHTMSQINCEMMYYRI